MNSTPQAVELELQISVGKPVILAAPQLPDMNAALGWLAEHRQALRGILLRYGHLLVRGLPIDSAQDFAAVRDGFFEQRAQYKEKATPRRSFGNDIYSSTEIQSMHTIRMHNENSYTLDFPGKLAFCCIEAPNSGGATTVVDVRKVLAAVPAELAARFRKLGWLLARHFHGGAISLPWAVSFGTDDRDQVRAYCEQNMVTASWRPDEVLTTRQHRPAVIAHPVTEEEVWFNHVAFWSSHSLDEEMREVLEANYGADALPFETYLGDGSALTAEEVGALNRAYDLHTCRESWRKGDVMFVDNILCAHGRESFEGGRRVLVAMGEPISLADCPHTPAPRVVEATAALAD